MTKNKCLYLTNNDIFPFFEQEKYMKNLEYLCQNYSENKDLITSLIFDGIQEIDQNKENMNIKKLIIALYLCKSLCKYYQNYQEELLDLAEKMEKIKILKLCS